MVRIATVALATLALLAACGGNSGSGSGSAERSSAASTPNTDQGRLLYCTGAGIVHNTLVAGANGTATTQDRAGGFGQAADKFTAAASLTTGPNKDIYRSLGVDTARMRVDLLTGNSLAFASDSSTLTADIKRAPDTSHC